ncbi:helix-turn-helix transcriptional regulator [Psychromonas aquimarina]|uniref:helix-turn-helix transcriptional regulator n=1 Tax=Psychromonas aquimarina TaxID=444919 RepID=UPI000407724A|nr:helix-turn-helix transcriptional regulator [Psychromonas aquimarina]
MFYINSCAFALYHILKEIDPENQVLNTIKLEAFSGAEACFISEDRVLPVLHALHKAGFYHRFELKMLAQAADSYVEQGRCLSMMARGDLGSVARSYICNAPTMGHFIQRMIDDLMFANRALSFDIKHTHEHVEIRLNFNNEEKNFNHGQGLLFFIAYLAQLFFGRQVKIDSFFCTEDKLDLETYRSHVSGTLASAGENYIRFKKDDFNLLNQHHNAYVDDELKLMLKTLRPCEPDFDNIKEDVLSKIKEYFLETNDYISADAMAHQFNMSQSTLYRKLESVNTSYRELVEMTRKELALKLIRESAVSFGEISHKLGYSNLTGFNRAFKRWLDISPTEYRRNL